MINEYDYDEEVMREAITIISIPMLTTPTISPRIHPFRQDVLFFDIQRLLQDQRLKEEKRIQTLKQKQHNIGQQVKWRLAEKDRKIGQLQVEQQKRTYAECTFKPKTISKGGQRSFEQFIQQQQDFTKKIEEKKIALKQNLQVQKDKKNTFKPKTNTRAQQERKKEGTVFDRLYALKDKENEDDGNSKISESENFHPKITDKGKRVSRNAPIDQLLYKDALRRQQRARDVQCQGQVSTVHGRALNLNNEKYVAQKFIREYYGVIENLNVSSSTQTKIDYMLFNEILKEMRFVQVEDESESSHERILIHQAYQLLEGYRVNAKNICVFLLALIGVFHINPINFQEGEERHEQQELAFDQAEGRKIQKFFDLFKRNRLFSQHVRKDLESEGPFFPFKPQINRVNDEMAEKHREYMVQEVNEVREMYPDEEFNVPQDGVITPTELLVLYNKAREIKLKNKKDQLQQKQLKGCTFKPTTQPKSQTIVASKSFATEGNLGQKKSLQLYNFHRQLQSKKQSRKQSLQASRQSEDPCTFAPKINQHRGRIQTDKSNFNRKPVEQALYKKNIEETLYRMQKGRDQMVQKKKKMERGEPSSLKKEQKQKVEKTEILLLDVNVGDRTERLTLYSGDENRLQEVAKEFAKAHQLDEQSELKLAELLQLEIESLLQKIPEDEQSDSNIQ